MGDSVTVDVFFDADGGVTIMSVAVIISDPGVLLYDEVASAALTPHPASVGPSGAQPSYILYTAATGMGPSGMPTTYLAPLQTPAFLHFPLDNPARVNINYTDPAFNTTTAMGTGIYIASMVFDVVAESGFADLSLEMLSGNLIQAGTFITDPATIALIGTPISVTVPEPAAGGLALAGLATVTLLYRTHRRRAQR
ncbi:MAG: PEP-CTERM sorting domain-containing protein [Myxococcota bacterium]